MAEESVSLLARKIGAGKAGAAAPGGPASAGAPDALDARFPAAVAKTAQITLSALLQADVEAAPAATGQGLLAEFLEDLPDPGVYYWLTDARGAPAALMAVAPAFAAALTVRLLGGELAAPEDGARAEALDFDMAGALADLLAPALSETFAKKLAAAPGLLRGRRGARARREAMGDHEESAAIHLTLDLAYEGAAAPGAIRLAFLRGFLEEAGLARGGAENAPLCARDESWSQALRRNILASEFPLTVVLDRIETNVGDLSRLQVGQVIELSPGAMQALDICVDTAAGPAVIAKGRLGAVQSRKAVKLASDIDPDFLSGL
ncbi:FliM/FliN family flagellar motor switch protein [Amphiplicatus metriothermophilus]|uniref:Flagellar motor switch protein FliM n=1 Tax=Amphiplicatus metriothermophilus TaxID=1519374 RepID=A0A239PKB8_9PROT|nr:FliM/FliN family flagellar motor C-terminal domain-containing protein [Amphiplicatus metriothermophilus]MBB5517403.1 flagellar motor switch/type III secretory pathway protein FliN [Amphiplicatus metriothermophilus]SNT68262.1 Flagellar motor switch protein FliM [Amphiplicatus metriothermophilus]